MFSSRGCWRGETALRLAPSEVSLCEWCMLTHPVWPGVTVTASVAELAQVIHTYRCARCAGKKANGMRTHAAVISTASHHAGSWGLDVIEIL